MRLSTLVCADPSCDVEVTGDIAMYHVIQRASDEGWTFVETTEETDAYCPLHSPDGPVPTQKWIVGCFTCDWEETAVDKEDADFAAEEHECEAEIYVRSPAEINRRAQERAVYLAERNERMNQEEEQARIAAEHATAALQMMERDARRWHRIRRIFMPWKKEQP